MVNYTKFAVRGVIKIIIISSLAGVLGYIVRLVLARNFSVEDFGLFNSVFAFIGFVGAFDSLGFDKALIKFIPEFVHEKKNDFIKSSMVYVCFIMLVINAIIIIGVYLFSSYLSTNFFHSPKADILLKILAIAFFVDSFVMVLKFAFQGFKEITYFSLIDVIRMLLVLIIIFVGIKLNYGLLNVAFAYTITPVILLLVFGWIMIRKVFPEFIKSKFIIDTKLFKRISKYSIYMVENSAAGLILLYTDTLSLTYFSNLKNVGLYSVAFPTARIVIFFPRAISGVLLPLTSELWVKGKKKILTAGVENLYKYSMIILLPLVLVVFSFSDLILAGLYGKDYILASTPMKILSIGMLFSVFLAININVFAGIGKPQITSRIIYTAAAFNLVTNLILIPWIGINGAAIASTLSNFIMALMASIYIKRFIKVKFPVRIWIKTGCIGLFFIFMIEVLKKAISLNVWVETPIILALSGAVYIALLFVFNVINIEELSDLYKRVAK